MRKGNSSLTKDQKNEIRALAKLPDDQIDTTEVPEVLDWSEAKRGLFYRHVDQQITSRPDSESLCNQKRGRNMSLREALEALSRKAIEQQDQMMTEEAAKLALVMPFMGALGYDIFEPTEVQPEYTADFAESQGKKVDYAIKRDNKPIILIECKRVTDPLDVGTANQLALYLNATDARFGILTNGILYKFYISRRNRMDKDPFLEINLANLKPGDVGALEKAQLDKASFDVEKTRAVAEEMKNAESIKTYLRKTYTQPSDEFVRFLANVLKKRRSPNFIRSFAVLVKQAFHDFVSEELKKTSDKASAIKSNQENLEASVTNARQSDDLPAREEGVKDDGNRKPRRKPTDQEFEGYEKVRTMVVDMVGPDKIVMRTHKNNCSVLFDDNIQKRICRLYFKAAPVMKLGLFDEQKKETKHSLDSVDDIWKYANQLQAAVKRYLHT